MPKSNMDQYQSMAPQSFDHEHLSPGYMSLNLTRDGGIKLKRFHEMGVGGGEAFNGVDHKANVYELIYEQKLKQGV